MAIKDEKRRIQVTLSNELCEKVETYCKEAGISKSAYFSLLAAKDLEDTEHFLIEFRKEWQEVMMKLNVSEE